jgi:hypothetical protein
MGLLVPTLPTIPREPRVALHAAANRWLGFGALFSLRYVPALTLLSLVFFFSYGPLEAALPVYSGQTLPANVDGYGLLWTGFGVGAFAGVLTLPKLSQRWRPGIALPMIAVLWGALLCPLFFIRQIPLAMLFLGVAGASWAPYTPLETTLLQRPVKIGKVGHGSTVGHMRHHPFDIPAAERRVHFFDDFNWIAARRRGRRRVDFLRSGGAIAGQRRKAPPPLSHNGC